MDLLEYKEFYKRRSPHFQPLHATLFLTFRLAGSIPIKILSELQEQFEYNQREIAKIENTEDREKAVYDEKKPISAVMTTFSTTIPTVPFG